MHAQPRPLRRRLTTALAMGLLGVLALGGWVLPPDRPLQGGGRVGWSSPLHAQAPTGEAPSHRLFLPLLDLGSRRVVPPIGSFGGLIGPRIWHAGSLYAVVGDRIEVHRPNEGGKLKPVAAATLPGRSIQDLHAIGDRLFVRYIELQGQVAGMPEPQGLRSFVIAANGRLEAIGDQRLPRTYRWWALIPIDAELALADASSFEPEEEPRQPSRLLLLGLDQPEEVSILDRFELPGVAGSSGIAVSGDRLTTLKNGAPCVMRCPPPRNTLVSARILERKRFDTPSFIEVFGRVTDLAVDGESSVLLLPGWFNEPDRLRAYDLDPEGQHRFRGEWPVTDQGLRIRSLGFLSPGLLGAITDGPEFVTMAIDLDRGLSQLAAIDLGTDLGRDPLLLAAAQPGSSWILGDGLLLRMEWAGLDESRIAMRLPFAVEPLHPYYAAGTGLGRSLLRDETLYAIHDRSLEVFDLRRPDDPLRRRMLPGLTLPGGGASIAASERDIFVSVGTGRAAEPLSAILVLDPPAAADLPPSVRGRIELPEGHSSRLRVSQGRLLSIEYAPHVSLPAGLRVFDLGGALPSQRSYLSGDMIDAVLVGEQAIVLHETGIQDRRLVLEVFDLTNPAAPQSMGPAIELQRYSAVGRLETGPSLSRLAVSGGEILVILRSMESETLLRFGLLDGRLEQRELTELGGACRMGAVVPKLAIFEDQLFCAQAGRLEAWQLDPGRSPRFLRSYRPRWLDPSRPLDSAASIEGFWVDDDQVYSLSRAGIAVYER